MKSLCKTSIALKKMIVLGKESKIKEISSKRCIGNKIKAEIQKLIVFYTKISCLIIKKSTYKYNKFLK